MKRYIAVIEIDDDEEIVGDANISYTYCSNGTNYGTNESVELKAEDEGQRMKTYEDGLKDAWECARSVVDCKVPFDFWDLASGQSNLAVFKHYSAIGAIEKIKEYENRIEVGDEVVDGIGKKCIVTHIYPNAKQLNVIWKDGSTNLVVSIAKFKKTGRHFPQIEEVLKQMQEDSE